MSFAVITQPKPADSRYDPSVQAGQVVVRAIETAHGVGRRVGVRQKREKINK
jgi:hypothetical protein